VIHVARAFLMLPIVSVLRTHMTFIRMHTILTLPSPPVLITNHGFQRKCSLTEMQYEFIPLWVFAGKNTD